MPLLDATVKETTRVNPPVHILWRWVRGASLHPHPADLSACLRPLCPRHVLLPRADSPCRHRKLLKDIEVGGHKLKAGQLCMFSPDLHNCLDATAADGAYDSTGLPLHVSAAHLEKSFKPER
jgi:hypothetical protein